MRISRARATYRLCVTALAGASLLVPLAAAAHAADRPPSPAVVSLPAPAAGESVTGPEPAPALTTTTTGQEAPGLLLTTPINFGLNAGVAAIYDNDGQLIWERPGSYFTMATNEYRGRPALTFYDVDRSAYLVLDQSYREIAAITMRNQPTDNHELEFSPDGSRVLIQGYVPTPYDLSPWGGPADATVVDTVIQEQIVKTGEVTFEWSALDHVPPDETTEPMSGSADLDLYHSNSLDYDTDGDILTSFRNTSTVYKIDISTGEIVWRFGGERSDFTFDGGAADMPSYQHDARRQPDGQLTLFDNGNTHSPQESRAVTYTLDESAMTATVAEDLRDDPPSFTSITGSNRQMGNGNQLVSFGVTGRMVEFSGDRPVFTGTFPAGWFTYRTERADDWTGTPAAPPDVVVSDLAEDGSRTMNVSWNGATEVDAWRIEAGPSKHRLTKVGVTPKTGFETAAEFFAPEDADVFRITALDDSGKRLGSRTVSGS